MKHNVSITLEQTLFREIENTRGREKRSNFIEYLITRGLKTYKTEITQQTTRAPTTAIFATLPYSNKRKED